MSVCVVSVYMVGPDICATWVYTVFNPVAPYRYLLPTMHLSVADIAKPDLLGCGYWTWISLDIARCYEEQCQPSNRSAWSACPKTVNRTLISGDRRG